jgi:catechol 2,3-dioxygenase-like lactoylglutathione lyase family enzyme
MLCLRFGVLKLLKNGDRFTSYSKVPVPSNHKSLTTNLDHKSRPQISCFGVAKRPLLHLGDILYSRRMALKRMDNVGIVVDDLGETIDFFRELGLELEGRATIEGEWAGRVTGLADQRVEIAMMRTPDGHSRLELSRFLTPPVVADHRNAPVNALGYLRVMFAVDDIDETLGRLRKRGAQLVGEVVRYQDSYRLCYIRGPEGLLIGLAQELN